MDVLSCLSKGKVGLSRLFYTSDIVPRTVIQAAINYGNRLSDFGSGTVYHDEKRSHDDEVFNSLTGFMGMLHGRIVMSIQRKGRTKQTLLCLRYCTKNRDAGNDQL